MIYTAFLLENNSKQSLGKQIYGETSIPHFPGKMRKMLVPPDMES